MIKVVGIINNRRTLILGLSRENTTRLHKNQPIAVDVQALLTPTDILDIQDIIVFAGETEESMATQLRKYGVVPS
jgi:hypothetical protein